MALTPEFNPNKANKFDRESDGKKGGTLNTVEYSEGEVRPNDQDHRGNGADLPFNKYTELTDNDGK